MDLKLMKSKCTGHECLKIKSRKPLAIYLLCKLNEILLNVSMVISLKNQLQRYTCTSLFFLYHPFEICKHLLGIVWDYLATAGYKEEFHR